MIESLNARKTWLQKNAKKICVLLAGYAALCWASANKCPLVLFVTSSGPLNYLSSKNLEADQCQVKHSPAGVLDIFLAGKNSFFDRADLSRVIYISFSCHMFFAALSEKCHSDASLINIWTWYYPRREIWFLIVCPGQRGIELLNKPFKEDICHFRKIFGACTGVHAWFLLARLNRGGLWSEIYQKNLLEQANFS